MRILLPSAAGCAAAVMVATIGLSGSTVASASPVNPDVSETPLTEIDADGLGAPGARAASQGTATVTNRSTTNLPGLLRSSTAAQTTALGPSALAGSAFAAEPMSLATAPGAGLGGAESGESADESSEEAAGAEETAPQEAAEESEGAEAPDGADESSDDEGPAGVGSVKDQTEDGVTIAAISKPLDVPSKNPSVVGVAFEGSADVTFEVRQRSGDSWSAWEDVDLESSEEGKSGSEPFVVIDADAVQLRALGDAGAPDSTQLVLVDPKRSSYDATAVANNEPTVLPETNGEAAQQDAEASVPEADGTEATNVSYTPGSSTVENTAVKKVAKPAIASRKEWGANESLRNGSPRSASSVKAAVVHHTAGSNSYAAEDVPSILRGIYSYHTRGQGWADVGYNVLADKYGRLWEGRAGGLNKAIIGAHAAGYNTGTFGISVLGTYGSSAPPQATIDAVNHAIAWKLSDSGVSATDRTTVNGTRIRTVVGHRDVGSTACPGAAFYSKLGGMRTSIAAMQAGGDTPEDEKKKESDKKKESEKKESDKKDSDKKDDSKSDDSKDTESDKKDDSKDEENKAESTVAIEKRHKEHADDLGTSSGKEFDIADGRGQAYANGHIYWTKDTGAQVVTGDIDERVDEDLLTQIGFPEEEAQTGLKDGGVAQVFSKGSVHWSEDSGAVPTWGILQDYWADKGTENGHLGYPTSDPEITDGRAQQVFQGARLVWAEGYGTTEFSARGELRGDVFDENADSEGDSTPTPEPSETAEPSPTAEPSETAEPSPTAEPSETASPEPSESPSASPSPTPSASPTPSPSATPSQSPSASPSPSQTPSASPSPSSTPSASPSPTKKPDTEQAKRDAIIAEAKKHMGVRYRWGGSSPTSGWDCSGYTQYVFGKNGINLPRNSGAQRNAGTVVSQKNAKPGDLIWVPGHVGIVSETPGQMYDAGSSRTNTSKRSYDWMLRRGAVFIKVI